MLSDYPVMSQPDWQSDQALANETGYHSVALLRNSDGLIPISGNVKNILIIAPPDALGIDVVLDKVLQSKNFTTQFVHYPDPGHGVVGDNAMINNFLEQTVNTDLTIVLTWQAHSNRILYNDDWQGRLVIALQQSTRHLVVVGLKSPTDLLEFPNVSTFIATFGTTGGQIQALADILVGNQNALGINPLPQLP
jgi:beta-N-acetylhexosaminidase